MTRPDTEVRDGTVVAGYRVLGVLGVGGSGTVYRAERVTDGALVALKRLNAEHAEHDGERQRFVREAEVVRQLAHPNVVALLDYGFVDDLPYLVFPLLEGRTLEARIAAEGKVGWGLTGRFSEQVLSALEVAHGLSIAHRDIKPANLFCHRGEGGESIRVLDFGTAKIVGPKRSLSQEVTRHGAVIGTPRYMAPEQVRGETLTPAADVYSFGLVMAEMLLGRPLVSGASDFQMYVEQGSDAPHVLPDEILSSPFAAVIERAVAKPLEVRYRLAGQMLADVRAILARYEQGSTTRGPGADLEATRFIVAPEREPVNESAEKLRQAFNAVASKAAAAAPVVPADPTALPTLVLPVVPPSDPPPAPSTSAPGAPRAEPSTTPQQRDAASAPDAPLGPAPARRTPRALAIAAAMACAVGIVVVAASVASRRTPSAPPAASSVEAPAPSSATSSAVAPSATTSAASPLAASAPPGAFTTAPVDPAPLARFVADKGAKSTPELYELALRTMADCDVPPLAKPTCPAWGAYEATLKRPMAKGGAKKRLKIATKYLGHAAPAVRILAARAHASAKSDEDFDGLLAAAKVEPDPLVLAEMVASMTRGRAELVSFQIEALRHVDARVRERAAQSLGMAVDQPAVLEALREVLTSDASPLVRASACAGLAAQPSAMPLEPVLRAAREGEADVRVACFAALTAAWVHTPTPRKEAYDATLAILEAKPRDRPPWPGALGRISKATLSFPPDDTVGPTWLKRATFYDAKKLCAVLEDVALDGDAGLAGRRAALEALGSIDGKKRVASVRKKLSALSDADSQALSAKPTDAVAPRTP